MSREPLSIGSLFSGFGGLDMAVEDCRCNHGLVDGVECPICLGKGFSA